MIVLSFIFFIVSLAMQWGDLPTTSLGGFGAPGFSGYHGVALFFAGVLLHLYGTIVMVLNWRYGGEESGNTGAQ